MTVLRTSLRCPECGQIVMEMSTDDAGEVVYLDERRLTQSSTGAPLLGVSMGANGLSVVPLAIYDEGRVVGVYPHLKCPNRRCGARYPTASAINEGRGALNRGIASKKLPRQTSNR